MTCPSCQQLSRPLQVGRNRSSTQRYRCAFCQRKYTPYPVRHGYDEALRRQAIARHLHVAHQTVANWVAAYAATLPDAPPVPPHDRHHPLPVVELDERYTFEGQKTARLPHHAGRRATRYIIAYDMAYEREPERLQALLNAAPSARQYSSNQRAAYSKLVYSPGQHAALPNKSQIYSVEGDSAPGAPCHGTPGTPGAPGLALAALRQHRMRQQERRTTLGSLWDATYDLVFPNRDGGMMIPHNLAKRSFKRLLADANLPNIRFQ